MAKTYGEFAEQTPDGRIPDLAVDRILGVRLLSDTEGQPAILQLQVKFGTDTAQLTMRFVEGMALLSMLRSHQLDSGLPFPDDPRA